MEKEKKRKNHKVWHVIRNILCVILCLVLFIVLLSAIGSPIAVNSVKKKAASYSKVKYSSQLVPEKDTDGYWTFTTDRNFKILQLADIHLGSGVTSSGKDKKAINAIATMITKEKPDLVIFTGDQAYALPHASLTLNNKSAYKELCTLMESLGVYWTFVFGNHDTEKFDFYSREDIADYCAQYKHCLIQKGPSCADGCGNTVIKIKNSKGIVTQALVLIDSHSYDKADIFGVAWSYDNIHENQIQWYKKQIKLISAENKKISSDAGTVSSLMFFHIPLTEYLDAWKEFKAAGYKDTDNVKYVSGILGETGRLVYCGSGTDDMFETICALGSTKAIFCGHDHYNDFTLNYKGIDLVYGMSVDYLAYPGISKEGSQRGCTVITSRPDSSFCISKYNYYSDRYKLKGFTRETDVTMQFADVKYQREK